MVNIAPYIPKYVRLLHSGDEEVEIPYSHTQFGVVLMVDVAGFSTLMTLATEKGDSGAEAIALEVGGYLGECIQIIEFYGGDVVKFLGDAVLVCFQASISESNRSPVSPSEDSDTALWRKKSMLVRRAVECGLQLLARLSHYRVYLTAEERSKHRTVSNEADNQRLDVSPENERGSRSRASSDDRSASSSYLKVPEVDTHEGSFSFPQWDILRLLKEKGWKREAHKRRTSDVSSASTQDVKTVDLELHIALSCGDVTNIVVGDVGGDTLAVDFNMAWMRPDVRSEFFLQGHGRLEYAIGGAAITTLDEALSVAKAGEMSLTPEVYDIIRRQSMVDLTFDKRRDFYIVRNVDPKTQQSVLMVRGGKTLLSTTPPTIPNANYLQDKPGLKCKASQLNIEPLVPRIRNTSYMQLSGESNPYYYKYVNTSALYRLLHSPDGRFPAQFREATIMFVSLGKVDVSNQVQLHTCQTAVKLAIRILNKYEGVLQQFAIDDKGATLLSIFGLPPLSHERDAVFAAKAAIEIRDHYRRLDLCHFAMSLSTGTVFNAIVPQDNPFRRDPGIAGDAIILAVRMLKFPFSARNVVCDSSTKQQIGGLCEFDDLGENFVKGKVKPVQVYAIQKFGQPQKRKRVSLQLPSEDFIGYDEELQTAIHFINDWMQGQNHHVLVVSGASGSGKTFFCNNVLGSLNDQDCVCCTSTSTEVDKHSKYFLFRNLLISVMETLDSDKVPRTPERAHSPIVRGSPSAQTFSTSSNTSSTDNNSNIDALEAPITPSPNASFTKRMTMYSSISPHNSYRFSSEAGNETSDLIRRCLRKCGEDEQSLPLFKLIYPTLNEIEDDQYTRNMDHRLRDMLLCNIVIRFVQQVADYRNLILFCDDVQWADPASVYLLFQVHNICQKALIVLATRPFKDYDVSFVKDLTKTGIYTNIVLKGLDEEEIGRVVLQSFPANVKKVHPSILHLIQKRTGGNPLYVKRMAMILKDFNHVTVVGDTLIPNNRSDLHNIFENFNYKRMIKMQFDRLDTDFQEVLTVAACLDQCFTANELQAGLKPGNKIFQGRPLQTLPELIHRCDIYHFLQQVEPGGYMEFGVDHYCFAHITIPHILYDMISYERRITLHRMLAQFYENHINKENSSQLLAKLTRQYLQTDMYEKQLYYLEELAELDMRSLLLPDATENLQRIVKILEENEDLAANFGLVHKSDVYRRLGICLTMRTRLVEAEQCLFKALQCLGFNWPKSNVEYLYHFWGARFRLFRHRHSSMLQKKATPVQKELERRILEIMMQLLHIYHYRGNGRGFIYACLVGLNACERIGETGRRYTCFLSRYALLCWLNDERDNAVYYITKSFEQMREKPDAGALNICAMLCFSAGKFSNARDLVYQAIDITRTLGVVTDTQEFYRSVRILVTMRIFEGSLDCSPVDQNLLKSMAETAHYNGDHEAEIWIGIYHVTNAIVMGELREADPFVALLQAQLKNAAEYNRLSIFGVLLCFFARDEKYEEAQSCLKNFSRLLPLLTTTTNTMPIFGLVFGTIGLYHLMETRVSFYTELVNDYDKYMQVMTRLNFAYQHIKFWECIQPGMYLARALPYISTGRIVEGYTIMRRALMEMEFLQEIRFLKAYYWATLGKYAFTEQDRVEWTTQARRLFDEMCIPQDIYCN